jgi:phytoene desaturase
MGVNIAVIGAGFSGIAAATCLADRGHKVTIYEKNDSPGGRARKFSQNGFTFDMGPSWYWMPDVFEKYFAKFNKKVTDYYHLDRLDPSYRVFFGQDDQVDVPADLKEFTQLLEDLEPGSTGKLKQFLDESANKYEVGMNDLVYSPGNSPMEFINKKTITGFLKLDLLKPISSYLRKYFSHPKILKLLEFPVLFLGAMPENTPALYSMMNYADIVLGTWYPKGGMHQIIAGMVTLAKEKGVSFVYNASVSQINIANRRAYSIEINNETHAFDAIISSADYHHVEQQLIPKVNRKYDEKYWQDRKMAPSCLLYYVGVDKKLKNLTHHNLFFDTDFKKHAEEIYKNPAWPESPLFYVCCPSKTDDTVAPEGCENLFILIPTAPGLMETPAIKEQYLDMVVKRLEKLTGQAIAPNIILSKSYGASNFMGDYNAFKGNAYGLANTLDQTAFLKPSIRNKRIRNLYNTGQLTVPGPGVPPSLISGQIAANELIKDLKKKQI